MKQRSLTPEELYNAYKKPEAYPKYAEMLPNCADTEKMRIYIEEWASDHGTTI